MIEHFCEYLSHRNDGVFSAAIAVDYSDPEWSDVMPCGEPARFQCGLGWWFCAKHYDLWVSFHGEKASNGRT